MTTSHSEERCIEDDYNDLMLMLVGSHALAKACQDDHFDYALKLRTGEVIRFTGATMISPGWIHLEARPLYGSSKNNGLPFPADRGVDVRIADIVWVMDAPEGS
jgi:hypothetical protein